MNLNFFTALIFISAHLRHGAAQQKPETMNTGTNSGLMLNCSIPEGMRSVTLRMFLLYDDKWTEWRHLGLKNINIDLYFKVLVKMAEEVHLGNVTCTNISLVLLGSREVNKSSGVVKTTSRYTESLDTAATLESLRNYSFEHKDELGHPDITVLVSGRILTNTSDFCTRYILNFSELEDPTYKRYCGFSVGATFYKGMCGSDSVAVIYDDSTHFDGATALAQQITTLMGVSPDIFRNESFCRNKYRYFTSGVYGSPAYLWYPGLSPCAEKEFTAFIDSSSNACWKDTPNTTSAINKPLKAVFQTEDVCSWGNNKYTLCNGTKHSESPDAACNLYCCEIIKNCTKGEDEEAKCEDSIKKFKLHFPPNGESCGKNGVCFNHECYEL